MNAGDVARINPPLLPPSMRMLELTSAGVGAAAVSSSAAVCLVLALLRRRWQELTAQAAQRTGGMQRSVSLEGLNELMVRPRRKTGVVLAMAAVLCVSPDSLFVRVANAVTNPPNVRPYDAMLSKFLFMAAANAVAAAWLQRGATVKMVAGVRAGCRADLLPPGCSDHLQHARLPAGGGDHSAAWPEPLTAVGGALQSMRPR